jgi:hypothetical protein
MSSEQADQPPHDVPEISASPPAKPAWKNSRFRFKFKLREEHLDFIEHTHKYSYPFLDDENNEDWLLLSLLNEHQPFKALHGEKGAIWDEFVETVHLSQSFDGTEPLANVRTDMIRQRFKKYIRLCEIWQNDPDFSDSLTDYSSSDSSASETPREKKAPLRGQYSVKDQIKNMVLGLFDEVGTWQAEQEAAKLHEARNAELERKGTVELKQATLGKIKGYQFLSQIPIGTKKGPAATSTGCSKHQGHSRETLDDLTNMENSMAVVAEAEKKKVEWKAMHEKRKLLEAENKSKELELQEKRLKMEEEKLKKDREAQFMQGQLMMEVTGLTHVLANQKKQKGVNNVENDKA